jgi:hypothetical protein
MVQSHRTAPYGAKRMAGSDQAPEKTPRKLKVIVTFSEMNNLSVCRQHGELPTVDVTAIRQGTGMS